ncbi:phage major capsid protein [Parasphingorhabdus halotolerans]|uniref:Phage major capsid protein n=1 Tax=Parasphingorhabdus halotolerans TaxID=2725558 RepID=A0A6H2DL35_9SPHN|nr:phage major capsid protein [Parasphingorhabdus halotolerans]
MELSHKIENLETKDDPPKSELEASFDAVLVAEDTASQGKAIAELRTDVDGLKSQMTDISKASARPALAGNLDGAKGMVSSAASEDFVSRYLRRGDHSGIELKSFSGASGPEGGFAVPREIDALIGSTLKSISPIRAIATIVQTGSAGYRKLVTDGGTPAGWVSETASRPETDTPNFNEIAPPTGELYANPAASQAMLDDAAFDVEAWLADEIAREFAQAEGAAFVGGSGVNQPRGFLNAAVTDEADDVRAFGSLQYVPSGSSGSFASEDALVDLVQPNSIIDLRGDRR